MLTKLKNFKNIYNKNISPRLSISDKKKKNHLILFHSHIIYSMKRYLKKKIECHHLSNGERESQRVNFQIRRKGNRKQWKG